MDKWPLDAELDWLIREDAPLNFDRPNPGAKDQASLSEGPLIRKH